MSPKFLCFPTTFGFGLVGSGGFCGGFTSSHASSQLHPAAGLEKSKHEGGILLPLVVEEEEEESGNMTSSSAMAAISHCIAWVLRFS